MMLPGVKAGIFVLLVCSLLVFPVSAGVTSQTSIPQTIVKADTVTLSGTGAQNGTMVLWILGRNYFDTRSANPDKKGNYTFVIKPEESNQFSTGQYAFVIQDPGADHAPQISPLLWADGIRVANNGKVLTSLGLKSDFTADILSVVGVLLNASARSGSDDLFTPYYFNVYDPTIRFNKVHHTATGEKLEDQTTGEGILITGTTNLGTENQLSVVIKNATSDEIVTSRLIPVESGSGENRWSYRLDAPGLQSGIYNITVSGEKYTTRGSASAQITILEYRLARPSLTEETPSNATPEAMDYGVLPLVISFAAMVIIGLIMLVSIRRT
jgi:hypothetical protein